MLRSELEQHEAAVRRAAEDEMAQQAARLQESAAFFLGECKRRGIDTGPSGGTAIGVPYTVVVPSAPTFCNFLLKIYPHDNT